ncbi:MAG: UDP-N-acetylmuramoyl-tripeptide--D-alanyl-D-alanine ligase [Bacteroidia bacterium]|nr:UDP-N-acetylmuramoyl-tripeptide--D-alanyl-D-alanine ligase [Bacteroidia bacterium]
MTFLSHDAMAGATGGRWVGPPRSGEPLAGIGTDTRVPLHGRAFVALLGEQHDAHHHLGAAQSAGAAALIVSRFPDGFTPSVPTLLVRDTLVALQQLATAWRAEVSPFTIGITGSSGKTTTRRLLHGVLSQQQRGTSSPKSFNNEIGVPLTMLSASRGDDFLLLEMGMNHPGEIRRLSAIAEQDAAVITMVGRAHLGGMGSLEAIATEKASIADGLPACAPLIVNGDNAPLMQALAELGRCDLRVITFGTDAARNVRLVSREQHPEVQVVTARAHGQLVQFELRLPGIHNAMNALAALAMGLDRGLTPAQVARGLATVEPSEMRMVRERIGSVDVYNDAYNANPDAVAAALRSFAEVAARAPRRVVVLGDMLELGDAERALHEEVGRVAASVLERGDRAWFIGPRSRFGADAAREAGLDVEWVESLDGGAAASIAAALAEGDAVLLKGSRGSAVERVLPALRAAPLVAG